ncbi:M48 family metallopeptidase [Deinococcus aquiradiocola]|uniref:YgjP-like metallopeptidase domain-containing protein n=1 Tax=Deinococcus aquiradiocola TaxID=393059 RepID=A0A917PIV3_9DEIO|nr:SprT family zinc-dependent metalloprotease [Deinococcus aquiradiocola]GGJ79558.1 hypothetical protein GCM10008939_24270 [Deinococcus aquiradiocola]
MTRRLTTPASPAHLKVGDAVVEVRRSPRRRTVALKVGPGGAVLYAPTGVSAARLTAFLTQRQDWLLGHLATFARQRVRTPLTDGQSLPLLDGTLTLRLTPGTRAARREGTDLHVHPQHLTAQIEAWYRQAALAHFTPLVHTLDRHLRDVAPQRRVTPLGAVRLTRAGSRWGSCTSRGDIRLHWRLMFAPSRVAHYVAAHEVAHLAQMDHSPRYWATLARLMPDYAEPKRWLREHGETLTLWDDPAPDDPAPTADPHTA